MKRAIALAIVVSAVVVGLVLAWNSERQDREFQDLIAQGDQALAQDQTFVAIEAFSGALALKPNSMLARLKRGDTYRRRGDFAAALRDLREAAALDASATKPRELLGDVNVAMQRYERAIDDYRAYVALDDRSPRVLYKLALTFYRNGQSSRAIEPLRQAIALNDHFAEAYHLLGMCLRDTKPSDALQSLTKAVALSPTFTEAREDLAALLEAQGKPGEGVEQLEALAALEPERAARAVAVGLANARIGRTDAAILRLSRAAEQHPEEPMVYAALGRVWLERAEEDNDPVSLNKAMEALEPGAGNVTASSETLSLFGRALLMSGDTDRAEQSLQLATSRMPVEPFAFAYLATAAERLGHFAVARDALVNYVNLAAQDSDSRYAERIAELSLRSNDGTTATTWARRALQASPDDVKTLGILAEGLWLSNERAEARDTLAQALQREPRNVSLQRLRRRFGA